MAERMSMKQALQLKELLAETPMTYEQLVEATGFNQPRLAYWRKSNAENIYVHAWAEDKNGRKFVPIWAWGSKPDAPRPGRVQTSAERMRLLRARRKQAGVAQLVEKRNEPVASAQLGFGLDDLI